MKYWVYINNKVDGPYDETSLVTIEGFTPDTLICSETVASSGGQEWVKASSVFEFDQEPVEQSAPVAQESAANTPNTQELLARLDMLSSGMANLQAKLESMQTHLDKTLAENKKLTEQLAAQQNTLPPMVSEEENRPNTITLTRHDVSKNAPIQEEESYPDQAVPQEEELIIRSALDSMYGEKPVAATKTGAKEEEDFHDLVTGETLADLAREEEQAEVENIATQLHFTPVTEEEPIVENAIITTPSVFEAEKDALINELTSSAKEDVLDQIIAEHEQEEQTAHTTQDNDAAALAAAGAVAGLAAAAATVASEDKKEEAFAIAPDKDNPSKLEEVLPADQLPEDVLPPAMQEPKAQEDAPDLPTIDTVPQVAAPEEPMQEPTQLPVADMPQEAAQTVPEEQKPQPDLPVADMPEELPQAQSMEEQPTQLPSLDSPSQQEPVAQPVQEEETLEELVPAASKELLEEEFTEQAPAEEITQPAPEEEAAEPVQEEEIAQPASEEEAAEPVQEEEIAQPAPEEEAAEPVQEEEIAQPASEEEAAEPVQEEEIAQPAPEEEAAEPVQEEEIAQPAPEEAAEPVQEEEIAQPAPEEEAAEPVQEEEGQPQQEAAEHPAGITDKDLQDAFGSLDEETPNAQAEQAPSIQTALANDIDQTESNPNELTEIELKEGSTYLISDFVPPAQLTDEAAENVTPTQSTDGKKKENPFQDMLATSTIGQSAKPLSTDGLPNDLSATQVNLENTIQAKRGASLDIKTVPMVPDPAKTDRLNMDELNDVNAQHGLKTQKFAKSTKLVIGGLITILALIVLYVALGLVHVLPNSINLFGNKQTQESVIEQNVQELLPEIAAEQKIPVGPAEAAPTVQQQAQEKVQNFPLPNGYSLKGFIESKHPAISPELITWEVADAVEADNYSITVKVPPENPQNFKTVYRFNYNMQTGLLDPTISDAKNLLDQAYGINPAQSVAVAATEPMPAPSRKTTRRNTRKR